MNIITKHFVLFLALTFGFISFGQGNFNLSKQKSSKIKFQLVNNVMVVPVKLNGIELSFVLDTGVSRPILFNLVNMDSLQIRNTERSFLRGLGKNGAVRAIKSKGNILKIGEAIAVNQEVSMVFDPSINFTPRLGVPVHGIIGYDIFKDFVVEINYSSKYLRLHRHDKFSIKESKSRKRLPIDILDKKPYLNAEVMSEGKKTTINLLIDTGSSDALWLFEKSKENLTIPKDLFFDDFLGKGLSGAVYGKRSKIESFSLSDFNLKEVNVAYPDSIYLKIAKRNKSRNGSLAGNILKRFNWFFDYKNKQVWIKKNTNFKSKFYYNNSGVVLEQHGFRMVKEQIKSNSFDAYGSREDDGVRNISVIDDYRFVLRPSFQIVELRESSNAKQAGLQIGDVVVTVNGKKASELSLQEINKFFYDKKGTVIRVRVDRDGKLLYIKFKLDDVFKKKEPSN